MARIAQSAAVADKAAHLAAAYIGAGRFTVASGSQPGKCYTVVAPYGELEDLTGWECDCSWAEHGGKCCAHVQAAARVARRAVAAKRRTAQAVAA